MIIPQDGKYCDEPRICDVDAIHIHDLIQIADATNLSPWSANCYLDELKNTDSIMLRLVSGDNTIIGFIVGRIIDGGEIEARCDAEIYNIAVVETERHNGRGQSLLDAFLTACESRAVVNIWLEVRESNSTAIRFYERNGFVRVQTRKHFYSDPREHALLMRLVLKNHKA